MKVFLKTTGQVLLIFTAILVSISFYSCKDDESPDPGPMPTGNETTYDLSSVSNPAISGTVKFAENSDNTTTITIALNGTSSGGTHPAHIHLNNAAVGGGIAADLTAVDGASGESVTTISQLNDGTAVTYNDLINFDGYVNVHLSMSELSTLIAQGDIGENALTGETESYDLGEAGESGVSGTVTFHERKSGNTLAVIELEGTSSGGDHPAHIHLNTAAEGGGIAVSFTNINGETGMSKTHISQLDNGTAITYSELIAFDGYVNVHLSPTELSTIIAQGDIGQNALTGEMASYDIGEVGGSGISGTATFYERANGTALAVVMLDGTSAGGDHPAHIHSNTAAEGGGIAVSLTNINGETGMSRTQIEELDNGTAVTYSELIAFNGYVNVHLSPTELPTTIAQGDIGQNALTGEMVSYDILEVGGSGVSGTATFYERVNGTTLVSMVFTGTVDGDAHPSHIHNNSASEGGGIAVSLSDVNGATGRSNTQVSALNDETPITYDELINYNGYINVHLSEADLATLIAQGDIGSNAD